MAVMHISFNLQSRQHQSQQHHHMPAQPRITSPMALLESARGRLPLTTNMRQERTGTPRQLGLQQRLMTTMFLAVRTIQ
jgi:hypothetical protein